MVFRNMGYFIGLVIFAIRSVDAFGHPLPTKSALPTKLRNNDHMQSSSSKNPYLLGVRGGADLTQMMGFKTTAATAAAGVVLKDYTSGATSFFSGIRTPASLVAAAALKELFALKGYTTKIDTLPLIDQIHVVFYNILMGLSFLLAVTTIVMSTSATTHILHGISNPMAESAYHLLYREFPFEFMTCRLGFVFGIFSFVTAVMNRVFLEFELTTKKERRNSALGVTFSMISLLTILYSYVNSTVHIWPNLHVMILDWVKTVWNRALTLHQPLLVVSVASTLAAFVCYASVFWKYSSATFKRGGKDE